MGVLSRTAVLIALLAVALQAYVSFWHWEDIFSAGSPAEKFFSADYFDARASFRQKSRATGAELYQLPIDIEDHELTIDVSVIRGSTERLLLHASGTHGVEGFAGSAIQCAALSDDGKLLHGNSDQPTVVFLHGVNPYGFAKLRRWNENNVDLNRNHLTSEEFEQRRSLDPNRHGYVDFTNFFYPPTPLTWTDFFWVRSVCFIARYGFQKLKKALVTGTYQHPDGIFYGGSELQPSHKLIRQFLQEHIALNEVRHAVLIDVHTGLGPSGFDSIFVKKRFQSELLSIVDETTKKHVVDFESGALSGYDDVVGDFPTGILNLFPQGSRVLPMGQEFGTVPGILVFKALQEESAAYKYTPWKRIASAERLRDVFYLRNSGKWKEDVVNRGTALFWSMHEYLQKVE